MQASVADLKVKVARPWWRREGPWLAAYIPLTLLFTWPLVARFTTALAGDSGDAWQTAWGFDWIRRSLGAGQNPFFTHDLWYPHGAPLVFQTFDLPDALWAAPLSGLIGLWPAHNLVMVAAFVLSGWTMYALCRSLGSSAPASFFAGCAYTFSTYHFAHTLGHMHIVAMQWVPLFALAWWKVLEQQRWRWAVAGGVFLTLASLASWYYLLGCFLIAVGIGLAWLLRERGQRLRPVAGRVLALCAVYLTLIGPLGIAMVRERRAEPIAGEHNAAFFSSDLQSFFYPNAAQELSRYSDRFHSWTGNPAETATYLGYGLLLLVLLGLALRAPRVKAYLLVALLGVIFALGPRLHWAGQFRTGPVLPYAWLVRLFPLLNFMGVPVRLGFAATFGLAAALAPALDALAARFRWGLLAPFAVLAVAEHTPHRFATYSFPTPAPMVQWAKDPTPFAVLDICRDMRPLWHQTIHHHPIMGGYLTRTPARLEAELAADPVVAPLKAWDSPVRRSELTATVLDFPFTQPVVPGAEPTNFSFELDGELTVAHTGPATFFVESDDSSELLIDRQPVLENGGQHPVQERQRTVPVTEGHHLLTVRYHQYGGGALLKVWWQPPGEVRRLVGPADVPHGFVGGVVFNRRDIQLPRDQALAHLRELDVRYVVQSADDSRYAMESQLGLHPMYAGEGVRIYEVPKP